MRKDIEFHCGEKYNFPNPNNLVRAFLYTDYSIQPHSHDFYEINIIMNGSGIHRIENSHIKARKGDVYVIPPKALHSYYDTHNLDVYHIIIHKDFIWKNMQEAEKVRGFLHLTEIEPFVRGRFSEKSFLHLDEMDFMALRRELDFIEEKGIYDKEELVALKNHTVWKIIYWFSHLMSLRLDKNSFAVNRYEQAILDTLEYIHNNLQEKITVELLCKRVYLSRSTFLRNFQAICQCTPMQYLAKYRCQKALDMLNNSPYSKTQIAHSCGFYDLSHMEKTIKKQ